MADRLPGLAAEIAFWVLLSLPALLLTAVAATSLVAGGSEDWETQLIDRIVEVSSVVLTTQAIEGTLRPVLDQLVTGTTVSVVSAGFLVTMWTASRAVKVVLVTIAITYGSDVPGGLAQRVLGLVLTLFGLLIGLVLAPLLIAGPNFGERLGELTDVPLVADVWRLAYWPSALVVVTIVIASLYHLGAPWNTRWQRDVPGAVLATVGWLAGSAALRLYGAWTADTGSIYGPLAGPLVGLLWLWLSGFAVLMGAELNAQIEHLWPTRSDEDGDGPSPTRLKRLANTTTSRLTFDPRELRRGAGS